jgi:hypothetical protein
MHPAELPRGKPQGLQRTIRHPLFYFKLFLSCYHCILGKTLHLRLCRMFLVFLFRLGSGEEVMVPFLVLSAL